MASRLATPTLSRRGNGRPIPVATNGVGASETQDLGGGLANSRFHTLLFGINELGSGARPSFGGNTPRSAAIVQLLCNQNCDRSPFHLRLAFTSACLVSRGPRYPTVSSSNEAGAKAFIDTSKLSSLTGIAEPRGRPRKSTCRAALAPVPDGSFTTIFPDLPATSHMRRSVPFKAGDDPKAVTSTPGRETLTPRRTAGNLPPGPVPAAASKGTLLSIAGTARLFPSQTRTRELHVPEYQ